MTRTTASSSTHTVSTKRSKARATQAINDYIICLRSAIFTPTGKDKDVTEGISPMLLKYDRNGLDLVINFAANLTREELRWAFDQCKLNMEEKYDRSGYGWDDDDKRKEYTEDGTRFLVVRERTTEGSPVPGRMVGFAHFRFSVQGDIIDQMVGVPSLFLWDLHLDESIRRKGLGKHMMMLLELIGRREKMHTICIPVQLFDEETTAWVSTMRGYSSDLILRDVLAFDPDMEGFNVFSKSIVAKQAVSQPAAPAVAAAVTPVKTAKSEIAPEQSSPHGVFEFIETAAEIEDGVSSGEEEEDSSEDEVEEGQSNEVTAVEELDISKLDLHDTIHGLKVLYREKHGSDASDEIVEQWLYNLQNVNPDETPVCKVSEL